MSIQEFVTTGMDNAPPKTKEIPKTIQNKALSGQKVDRQAKQPENSMSGVKRLTDAIAESLNLELSSAHISFIKDDDTGDIIIKIIDSKTDEVIRQIPPEEIMELRKRLGDLQGLFLDRKA